MQTAAALQHLAPEGPLSESEGSTVDHSQRSLRSTGDNEVYEVILTKCVDSEINLMVRLLWSTRSTASTKATKLTIDLFEK